MISYSNRTARSLYFALPGPLRDAAASLYSLTRRPLRYGGVFSRQLADFESGRGSDPAERLRRLLLWAGEQVPYYQQLFRACGFDPRSDDFCSLPLLDKRIVGDQPERLMAAAFRGPTLTLHTSGTTGSPLHLRVSHDAYQRGYAAAWFHYGWAGVRRGERFATLAGHPVAPSERLSGQLWVHDWLEQELLFSSQHLAPSVLAAYAAELARWRPVMVRGYPSSVYRLALHLLEQGQPAPRPRAVFTFSETLLDHQRQAIEAAFGCPVYSKYGSAEQVAHILQCQARLFHVLTPLCVVEVLQPDGRPAAPGQEGELVCTSLVERAMPLLRYRTGDRATAAAGPCPCGRPGPLLSDIGGRVEDVVVTPDGRHAGRLDHVFKGVDHVAEAQIVQEQIGSVRVNVVTRPGWGEADERHLLDNLRFRLGPSMAIELRQVAAIPRTAGGKFRFVVSRLPAPQEARPTQPTETDPSR